MKLEKPILTPHSLPLFKSEHKNRLKEKKKLRDDPLASKRPPDPLFEPVNNGKVEGLNSLTQYILREINKRPRGEDDPRLALLSYAKEAADNPEWVN